MHGQEIQKNWHFWTFCYILDVSSAHACHVLKDKSKKKAENGLSNQQWIVLDSWEVDYVTRYGY